MILKIRHWLYNVGIFSSYTAPVPTIVVGNLAGGGTGKSPMVLALLEAFSSKYNCAVVSRGYGRSLNGVFEVEAGHTVFEVGDEPTMIKKHFPNVPFVVGGNRKAAIELALANHPELNLIILDDAFQHRKLKGTVNILLDSFHRPFSKDYLFPVGKLRDLRSRARAADILVRTKVPLAKAVEQFDSYLEYGAIRNWFLPQAKLVRQPDDLYAITGLANPQSFYDHLKELNLKFIEKPYKDHYTFSLADVKKWNEQGVVNIVCTEKDAVKLEYFQQELKARGISLWVLPVKTGMVNFEAFISKIEAKIEVKIGS